MRRNYVWLLIVVTWLVAAAPAAWAAPAYSYTFETHAAFFSAETQQQAVVDPQVFVADAAVSAGTGPQNIAHIAGYRPARPGSDPAGAPLFTAQGRALAFSLGTWLGAHGEGTTACDGNTAIANARFSGLVPHGLYQMTRLQFTPQGPQRTPLGLPDGSDSTFSADASGSATFTGRLPFCPATTEGVVIAFHGDGMTHGAAMGNIGVNLHNQLATRNTMPPGLPNTGAGGGTSSSRDIVSRWLLAAIGGTLLLTLWQVRRRAGRTRC